MQRVIAMKEFNTVKKITVFFIVKSLFMFSGERTTLVIMIYRDVF